MTHDSPLELMSGTDHIFRNFTMAVVTSFLQTVTLLLILLTCIRAQIYEADATRETARCDVVAEDVVCVPPSSIYGSGGTAVAYVPNQPVSSTICKTADQSKYRVSGWPFSRSTWNEAPVVQLKINVLGCKALGNTCCCQPLNDVEIEAWQARPDGIYSSLAGGGDCRTRSQSRRGRVVLDTVAPGSTGSLGGIGPSGWDFAPYGPPVLHVLVKTAGHAETLVDVPVSVNMETLEQGSFWGPDFRGAAWVRAKNKSRFKIVSWKGYPELNRVELEVDVYLPFAPGIPSTNYLCPSFVYGLPSSFFLEPIAVCAPSMLDFFDL